MSDSEFAKFIGIDWSGASTDDRRVDVAIAEAPRVGNATVALPPTGRSRRWTRNEAREWLAERLRPQAPRALVGVDAALGYPYGTASTVFGVELWTSLVREIGDLYSESASEFANGLNQSFEPAGAPFRRNHNRTDFRFYVDNGVAYYRQCDLLVPQAISAFYMGSGAAVGYHTITFLAQLAKLFALRETGELDFRVWPHETGPTAAGVEGDFHVVAEVYPSILPTTDSFVGSDHERDATKVAQFLQRAGSELFAVPRLAAGRVEGVRWEDQIEMEGWILGVA